MKVIVFGAGEYGKKYIDQAGNDIQILAVADNYLHGKMVRGHKIISLEEIQEYDYDKIIICLNDYTNLAASEAMDSIINQLHGIGVSDECIELQNIYYAKDDSRVLFLKEYSESVKNFREGAVAECGVMRGHFAHYISKYFNTRTFYMFDTFSGFDERDIRQEPNREIQDFLRTKGNLLVKNGNEKIALRRCMNKENIIIRKGVVPDTFCGLENERFIFVNLDMDIYAPTIAALCWFSERMVKGGVILCHDYLDPRYPGIKDAVDEFSLNHKFIKIYLPSAGSVAIIMQE